MMKSHGSTEILQVVEAVSREKGISRESILAALEETIQSAAKRKYGTDEQLIVKIDRKTGDIKIYREILVVSDEEFEKQQEASLASDKSNTSLEESSSSENSSNESYSDDDRYIEIEKKVQMPLSKARLKNAEINAGDTIYEQLPPLDLSRLSAYASKNLIMNKVKDIERDKQYHEFIDRVGTIVQGVVEKVDPRSLIVKIAGAEAILRHDQMIRTDHYKQGDKIRAYLAKVDPDARGPQLILSRTHNEFIVQLLVAEVPEIDDGIIEIKSIIRDPGSRAKVAVYAADSSIDPIGSCIGIKGSRIQAVSSELNGEKIDVILWSSDIAQFLINALHPTQVQKIIMDEENHRIEIIVPDHQFSAVIGRRGQNIRLVSQLISWNVGVTSETEESKKRGSETNQVVKEFMYQLDIDDILAQLLAAEGYVSVRELASESVETLTQIQGLDEAIAEELIFRAQESQQKEYQTQEEVIEKDSSDNESSNTSEVQQDSHIPLQEIKSILAYNRIRTMKDIADLASDELQEILEKHNVSISNEKAEWIINNARKKVYFHIANQE